MAQKNKQIEWIKRWWLKITWGIAMLIIVVLMVTRCTSDDAQTNISPSLNDSLQCVYDTTLQRADYEGFRVFFSEQWHIPACVAYELTVAESHGTHPRSDNWVSDTTVAGCPISSDYRDSGYDRGHMAPAGDFKWSTSAMQQSFTMTNACPQNHSLNEGAWQRLEEKVREWVQRDKALIVLTGPIVTASDTATINGKVRIPSAFYKIVLAHNAHPMRVASFVYPNANCQGTLRDYAVTVRDIEHRTGINFFKALPQPEQDRLETTTNLNYWLN